jgi:hypothetical protein
MYILHLYTHTIYICIHTHIYIHMYIHTMEYYSVIKKSEIMCLHVMDGTGDHHVKWSKPGLKGQRTHDFPHYVEARPKW